MRIAPIVLFALLPACPDTAAPTGVADALSGEVWTDSSPSTDVAGTPDTPLEAGLLDAPPDAAPDPLVDVAGDATPPCDPATFTPLCSGTVATNCLEGSGVLATKDCADTINPVCVIREGTARCQAVDAPGDCALDIGLPTCVSDDEGKHYALWCVIVQGVHQTSYHVCGNAVTGWTTCQDSPLTPGTGECLNGPPCSGSEAFCEGDTLRYCDGVSLGSQPCDLFGKECVESTLGVTDAGCMLPGQEPCDPATFLASCSSASEGTLCHPELGVTSPFECQSPTATCCVDDPGAGGDVCCP